MNKEILDTLDDLSKRPTTELAMRLMKTTVDNMAKDKELERYKNIIDELEKKLLDLRLTDVDGRTIVYRLLDKLKKLKGE